jgi:DNA-binding GntR family transcriptional regulator
MAIYAGCSSPLLREMVGQLFDAAERYRRYSAKHRKVARHKHAEHTKLMQAVLSRDARRAGDLLIEHVSTTERNVTTAFLAMGSKRS